jgi:16S rRNA (cytosine1402-N4)-methyltransferase
MSGTEQGDGRADVFVHEPVMVVEIVEVFTAVPSGWVLDATLGGGGHSERILERRPDIGVIGIDRDQRAIRAATERLARFGDRVVLRHARFDELRDVMQELAISNLSGALFDLGVSSPQLDEEHRGFSYRHDAPLDMRMDPSEPWTAADVVNGRTEQELADILRRHADERFAHRIAKAIVAARPIETTRQLADVVTSAIPAATRRRGGHPAKRTFQAIRIEVNRELEILPDALDTAIAVTVPGGRVAVLSYHSGEDRLVKERFRSAATGGCTCPFDLPCVCGAVRTVRLVRVPATPAAEEIERNRRASSARLRVAEVIPYPGAPALHDRAG